jgi:hypothetical protein
MPMYRGALLCAKHGAMPSIPCRLHCILAPSVKLGSTTFDKSWVDMGLQHLRWVAAACGVTHLSGRLAQQHCLYLRSYYSHSISCPASGRKDSQDETLDILDILYGEQQQ